MDRRLLSARVQTDTYRRAVRAVKALQKRDSDVTLQELVDNAVRREVRRLEKNHNHGRRFESARSRNLTPGPRAS